MIHFITIHIIFDLFKKLSVFNAFIVFLKVIFDDNSFYIKNLVICGVIILYFNVKQV